MGVAGNKISTTNTFFFDIAMITYLLWGCLREIDVKIGNLNFVIYVSLAFAFISLIQRSCLNINRLLMFLCVAGLAFYVRQFHHDLSLLPISFLVFAASGIKVSHILKIVFVVSLLLLIIVCFLSSLGILSDKVYSRTVELQDFEAHSMGFKYYSHPAFRIISLVSLYLCVVKNKLSIFKLFGLALIIFCSYYLTSKRLLLLSTCSILLLYIAVYKFKLLSFKAGLWRHLSLYSYFLLFTFSIVLPVASFVSPYVLDWLNEHTSGRMSYMIKAFYDYPVNLWGNAVDLVGALNVESTTQEYFYIDSGYVYWLLVYGLVITILILLSYTTVFYRSYKNNNKQVYMCCLLYAFINLSNDFYTISYINPLIFLLFADFSENKSTLTKKYY